MLLLFIYCLKYTVVCMLNSDRPTTVYADFIGIAETASHEELSA